MLPGECFCKNVNINVVMEQVWSVNMLNIVVNVRTKVDDGSCKGTNG